MTNFTGVACLRARRDVPITRDSLFSNTPVKATGYTRLSNGLECGSTGTYPHIAGHAPPSSLDELVRITRPDGHVIFIVRSDMYEGEGFKEKQQALVKNKRVATFRGGRSIGLCTWER